MDQKNILCFGDSNTHGYNSKTGGRFTVEELDKTFTEKVRR